MSISLETAYWLIAAAEVNDRVFVLMRCSLPLERDMSYWHLPTAWGWPESKYRRKPVLSKTAIKKGRRKIISSWPPFSHKPHSNVSLRIRGLGEFDVEGKERPAFIYTFRFGKFPSIEQLPRMEHVSFMWIPVNQIVNTHDNRRNKEPYSQYYAAGTFLNSLSNEEIQYTDLPVDKIAAKQIERALKIKFPDADSAFRPQLKVTVTSIQKTP